MAKLTAPLLSIDARGQFGKSMVFANWRGVAYSRRFVIPSNPNTAAQQQTRGVFNWLNQVWKLVDPDIQAIWTAFAKGKQLMNRNAWQQKNVSALRGTTGEAPTTLAAFIMSPGVGGGLAAANLASSDAGTHHLELTLTAPALPSGWAITNAHFLVFVSQEAATSETYGSSYMSDDTSPYQVTFDFTAAATYDCFACFEYTKPNGQTAYSPSLYAHQIVA